MTYRDLVLLIAAALPVAASIQGDSSRGAVLFEQQKCVTCHAINGKGGRNAPDLGKRSGRDFTPASLAATLWNHAPAMWSAMDASRIAPPKLDSQQSADLFAYFYAARFFDAPGDAGRGRKVFVEKRCAECHNISTSNPGSGTPVLKWEALVEPIELSRQMWNHSPQMRAAAARKGVKIEQISAKEMTDMIVYLQSLPQTKGLTARFSPASTETGETLLNVKGCVSCHQGSNALPKAGVFKPSAEFAADMWNHSASMRQSAEIRPEEMTRIVGYLFSKQFEKGPGAASRGERVLSAKGCTGCHKSAPKASTPYEIMSGLWTHGPAMRKEMTSKNVSWPRFSESEMADLMAALQR